MYNKYGRATATLNEDGWLTCPDCGEAYLHHGTVTVYDRDEDSKEVLVTTSDPDFINRSSMSNEASANPSARRSGMIVNFWCENCGQPEDRAGYKNLAIFQHKGATFIEWVK